jgi:hypothetical protein
MTLQEILDNYPDQEFIILDGLDRAVIGIDQNYERLVYSVNEIVDLYIEEGMTYEEALDYYEYKTARGVPFIENGPILVYLNFF